LPVSGKLYIGLIQGHQVVTGGTNQDIYYQNLQVDIIPFINGSYQRYTGHSNKVIRSNAASSYNAIRDKEVFLGDSTRSILKGSMFFLRSDLQFKLTQQFYSANSNGLGNPDKFATHPFGHLQAYSVWNQYRLANRIFPSSVYGLFRDGNNEWPDLPNKFQLSDDNPNTNFRYFMLVSFDQDWRNLTWTATFIEMFRNPPGHDYGDYLDFKYITG